MHKLLLDVDAAGASIEYISTTAHMFTVRIINSRVLNYFYEWDKVGGLRDLPFKSLTKKGVFKKCKLPKIDMAKCEFAGYPITVDIDYKSCEFEEM